MQDAFIFDTQVDRGCPCLSESDASRLLSRIHIQLPLLDPSCAFQTNWWAKVRIVSLGIVCAVPHEHGHILKKSAHFVWLLAVGGFQSRKKSSNYFLRVNFTCGADPITLWRSRSVLFAAQDVLSSQFRRSLLLESGSVTERHSLSVSSQPSYLQ